MFPCASKPSCKSRARFGLAGYIGLFRFGPGHPADPAAGFAVVARVYFADRRRPRPAGCQLDVWQVKHAEGYLLALLSPGQYDLSLRQDTGWRSTSTHGRALPAAPGPARSGD